MQTLTEVPYQCVEEDNTQTQAQPLSKPKKLHINDALAKHFSQFVDLVESNKLTQREEDK